MSPDPWGNSPEAKKLQATINELNKRVLLYTLSPGQEEGVPWPWYTVSHQTNIASSFSIDRVLKIGQG